MIECKCYFENISNLKSIDGIDVFGNGGLSLVIGKRNDILTFLKINNITKYHLEVTSLKSRKPLLDTFDSSVRIEPGAIIRQGVALKEGAIVLMNAVINEGAIIGEKTQSIIK